MLNEKTDAIYAHGGQAMLKDLPVVTAATDTGKSTIVVNAVKQDSTNKWYYVTASTVAGLTSVAYNTGITVGNWTELTANGSEISATDGYYIRVIETFVDTNDSNAVKPIAVGDALINAG